MFKIQVRNCNDYRAGSLPKSYLTVIGIVMQSLKTIEQFKHV